MESLPIDRTFGQYRILRLLGRGGMGAVYEVEHTVLRKIYALKTLSRELMARPEAVARLKREAMVMSQLAHPRIVSVDDFGETDGCYWLRMEKVKGFTLSDGRVVSSLKEYLAANSGRLSEREVIGCLKQLLEAFTYAHGLKVVHRDLKPSNILLDEDGAKISDFGLVHLAGSEWFETQVQLTVTRSVAIMQGPGAKKGALDSSALSLLGTYDYMSPEQKRGEAVDARSDLYSMGLLAFGLLTGEAHLGMERPSDLVPGIDPGWDAWLARAVHPVCDRRFASAAEMEASLPKQALHQFQTWQV